MSIQNQLIPLLQAGTENFEVIGDGPVLVIIGESCSFVSLFENFTVYFIYLLIISLNYNFQFSDNEPVQYVTVLDGTVLDYLSDYIGALQMLISMFFVFNRTYPDGQKHLLEFIQMRFCNIFSLDATRSKLKNVTDKVHTFFNYINKVVIEDAVN